MSESGRNAIKCTRAFGFFATLHAPPPTATPARQGSPSHAPCFLPCKQSNPAPGSLVQVVFRGQAYLDTQDARKYRERNGG